MVNENGEAKTRRPPININRDVGPFAKYSWDRFRRSVDNQASFDQFGFDHFAELVGSPQNCYALSIECVPHKVIPPNPPVADSTTQSPVVIISSTEMSSTSSPTIAVEITSTTETSNPEKPNKLDATTIIPITPIDPVIQPGGKPTVVVPFEPDNHTEIQYVTENFHMPWTASIYIDGDLSCIGILLGELWVLAESSCVNSTRY